jgi:hypothetical protein
LKDPHANYRRILVVVVLAFAVAVIGAVMAYDFRALGRLGRMTTAP